MKSIEPFEAKPRENICHMVKGLNIMKRDKLRIKIDHLSLLFISDGDLIKIHVSVAPGDSSGSGLPSSRVQCHPEHLHPEDEN